MLKKIAMTLLLAAIALGLTISCVAPKPPGFSAGAGAALVWPPAPDEARIAYVGSISSPADIGLSPSGFKRAMNFLTGTAPERHRFIKPLGIALDESGNLCVTDTGNNTVSYLDLKKKTWRHWEAVGKTRFAAPVSIARKTGIFYVADSELGKVFVFGEDGREVLTISKPLQRPVGLAISGESLAVVDSQTHAVFVFDLRGALQFQFGQRGGAPGEFNFPTHIATDGAGHWLVTDSLNSRVQVFDAQGKFLSQIGSGGDAPGHFGRPKGVAADSAGHIYVLDAVFDTMQVFDLSGQFLLTLGSGGAKPGEFALPSGIAIGTSNHIYVADSYNQRVQIFKYVGPL